MTQALAAAFASASRLPEEEQVVLASLLVAEMDSEERWNTLFSQSQGVLADLAEKALSRGDHQIDQGAEL
jgi:DNA-binding transcriptional regulator YbjK